MAIGTEVDRPENAIGHLDEACSGNEADCLQEISACA